MLDQQAVLHDIRESIRDLDRRLQLLEANNGTRIGPVHLSAMLVNNTIINAGNTITVGPMRTSAYHVPPNAKGVIISAGVIGPAGTGRAVFYPADAPMDDFYPTIHYIANIHYSCTLFVPLGMDGRFKVSAIAASITLNLRLVGHWT